jgi:hypothetical protein
MNIWRIIAELCEDRGIPAIVVRVIALLVAAVLIWQLVTSAPFH